MKSDNSIVSVNAFLVRGSGLFDDIELTTSNIEENVLMTYYTIEEEKNVMNGYTESKLILYKNYHENKKKIMILANDFYTNYAYLVKEAKNVIKSIIVGDRTYILVPNSASFRDHGYALYVTNGTPESTVLLHEFVFPIGGANHQERREPLRFVTHKNEKVYLFEKYFHWSDRTTVSNLWETDGTKVGTKILSQDIVEVDN